MTSTTAAPDVAGTIVGWRTWRLVRIRDGIALSSIYHHALWHAGERVDAQCRVPGARLRRWMHKAHAAPSMDCECGIYAARELRYALCYMADIRQPYLTSYSLSFAVGRVKLWGEVVEGEHGWRATHAYPADLYLPVSMDENPRLVAEALEWVGRFGVPVATVPCDEVKDMVESIKMVAGPVPA